MPLSGKFLAALALAGLLAYSTPALAASSATESYSTLLGQIGAPKSNPQRVTGATIDKDKHHVRVTLASGSRPLVVYPAADDRHLVDLLLHNHITIIYAKHKTPHHVLRYVAAGVVVVLVLIGGGVWWYTRGRGEPGLGAEPESPEVASD